MPKRRIAPFKCHMPDLSGLPVLFTVGWMMREVVGVDDGKKARSMRYVFTRLVDRAIREYQESRTILARHEEETKESPWCLASNGPGGLPELLVFTDHFETCILSIARLLKIFGGIRGDKHLGKLVPKTSRKFLEAQSKGIIVLRNAIEHVDEKIRGDDPALAGAPFIGLDKNGRHALILSHKVSFEQTASVLKHLHGIAVALAPRNRVSAGIQKLLTGT